MFVILGSGLVFLFLFFKDLITQKKENVLRKVKSAFMANRMLFIFLLVLAVLSLVIFLPVNKNAGGLGWYPLEWPKIFLGPSGLNWGDWFLRQQVYEQAGNIRNIVILDIMAIVITLICIHGTRLIGLIPSRRVFKNLSLPFLIFFIPGLILFHILGLFTLQKAGGFNVFNFFVVCSVVLSLFSAMLLDNVKITLKRPFILVSLFVLVLLSIPRNISEIVNVFENMGNSKTGSVLITLDELEGLRFLRTKTPKHAIVQSHPTDRWDSDTPYVSFFSERLTYLTGGGLQRSHNQPIAERMEKLNELFQATDSPGFQTRAKSTGIEYLYLKKTAEQRLPFPLDPHLIERIFENDSIIIYQIH